MDKTLTDGISATPAAQRPTQSDQRSDMNASVSETAPPSKVRASGSAPNPTLPTTEAQLAGYHAPGEAGVPDEFWEAHWVRMRQTAN
jgi:hypothetical protein